MPTSCTGKIVWKRLNPLLFSGWFLFLFSSPPSYSQDPMSLLGGGLLKSIQEKGGKDLGLEVPEEESKSAEVRRLEEIEKIEGEPLSRLERFFVGEEGERWIQIEKELKKERLQLLKGGGVKGEKEGEQGEKPGRSEVTRLEPEDPLRELIERRLKGEPIPEELIDLEIKEGELRKDLRQFGYDLFKEERSRFAPSEELPVGPNYVIGPGDELTVTLWGIVEGIFQLKVSPEGEVTLPKVGVVSVAGVRFGDVESYLREHLSRYYKDFNIRVTMSRIHTIQVYVVGEVEKPGRYTVSSLSTAFHALFSAGGPTKDGSLRSIQVLRNGEMVQRIDLYDFIRKGDTRQDVHLLNGDTVFVPIIGEVVALAGEVYRPAIYEVLPGEGLDQVLEIAGGLLPIASKVRIQIERFEGNEQKILLDVEDVAKSPGGGLQNLDLIKVYPVYREPWGIVTLEGVVRYPGEYSFREGMRISDLLRPEQLLPETFTGRAEVVRLDKKTYDIRVIEFSPEAVLRGDRGADLLLEPRDRLVFFSYVRKPGTITLEGEVQRPGAYSFERGERLSSVLKRAGGYTEKAFPQGAIFTRKAVAEGQERQRRAFLTTQEKALLQESAAVAASGLGEDAQTVAYELNQRRELLRLQAERVQEGRIVIRLAPLERFEGGPYDILLEDGDKLIIPQVPAYVSVMGEVRNPSSFVYKKGEGARYYIAQAGGFTSKAEKEEAYILRSDGTAAILDSKTALHPGDSIVIPTKLEVKYRPLPFWRDIASIVGDVAVTIVALVTVF